MKALTWIVPVGIIAGGLAIWLNQSQPEPEPEPVEKVEEVVESQEVGNEQVAKEVKGQVKELKKELKDAGKEGLVDKYSAALDEKVSDKKEKYLKKVAAVKQLNYQFTQLNNEKNNYIFAGDSDNPKVAELDEQLVKLQNQLLAESEAMNADYKELYLAYAKAAEEQLESIRRGRKNESSN